MANIWQTFWRLPVGEKTELFEAVFFLARAHIEVKLFSFKALAAKLGSLTETPPAATPESLTAQALRVKRAIQRTHRTVPWENVCLPQAIAAMRMLTRRKIPAHLYFGAFSNQSALKAHAWVRTGALFVTGKRGHHQYATVAMFSNRVKL